MKRLAGFGVLLLVGLGLATGYQYYSSAGLDRRLRDQETRLERVSLEHGERLGEHAGDIQKLNERTAKNAAQIVVLEGRIEAAAENIRAVETELEEVRAGRQQDQERVVAMETELRQLQQDQSERTREVRRLRQQVESRELDLEQRLHEIEERLGIQKPVP